MALVALLFAPARGLNPLGIFVVNCSCEGRHRLRPGPENLSSHSKLIKIDYSAVRLQGIWHSETFGVQSALQSKIGRSCGLHSGLTLRIGLALRISIQNRPEFWIAPLHGVPLQMP